MKCFTGVFDFTAYFMNPAKSSKIIIHHETCKGDFVMPVLSPTDLPPGGTDILETSYMP